MTSSSVILVTGGAGYIGSHVCVELIYAGFDVVVIDNLSLGNKEALIRAEKIAGRAIPLIVADVKDVAALSGIFNDYNIKAVLHFAGLKSVSESHKNPLSYYRNNVESSLVLCDVMQKNNVNDLIFSSSATVYGEPEVVPINEKANVGSCTNPYGKSKFIVEEIYRDLCRTDSSRWKITLLRYFNPVGAHSSGLIGESPQGAPNNLFPLISKVAIGELPKINVYGGDYSTFDGTGVRDYIHVVDLARGHVKALERLLECEFGCYTYNLGTGKGYSVLDIIKEFECVSGRSIPYEIVERRSGDVAICFADCSLASTELNWMPKFNLARMVEDTWRWQVENPNGY